MVGVAGFEPATPSSRTRCAGDARLAAIILRADVSKLSNNIIQKGLAFDRDWSGTVAIPDPRGVPRSCPAGLLAEAGLRWWRRDAALNRTEDLDVKVGEDYEEAIGWAIGCSRCHCKA